MRVFNGERLKEARYFNSLSITELAEILEVSKQMVSKYENGKAAPSAEVFFKIISNLKFPSEFYYQADNFNEKSTGTFYRSRLTSTQKQKAPSESIKRAAVIYRDFLEDFIEFPNLIKPDIPDLEDLLLKRNFEDIAKNLRSFWGLKGEPITNLLNLMEQKGFVISMLPQDMDKVDAFGSHETINDNSFYVILSKKSNTSFYRQQFSLAHELGHWLFHADLVNPQELDAVEYREKEAEANEFASCFLLPKEEFLKDISDVSITLNLLAGLKGKWNVAIGAMLMRAYKLDAISDEQYLKLQKQISYKGWRKSEPLDETTPLSVPVSLRQATELLVDNDVFNAHEIPMRISTKYKRLYPTSLLEKIAELESGYFNYTETEVVKLKF